MRQFADRDARSARPRWTGTIAWILLVLASMVLIGYGIARANWHIWLPSPAEQEEVWIGSRYILAGCALSLAAGAWSHLRGNPVWVTVCVALPGILVGWAAWVNPYNLMRHLAALVAFPLALGGVVGVIRVRGHRQGLVSIGREPHIG
ncbi:hypothetical protein QF038_001877 [Pseudarthrobacter sp. W1I19]|uniref:hypothetical protein n=1 Tax=Pseudarthrobacter sp. W1I19 TaxID=3042288 RepID=UPI0027878D63|nr:hypothetical protein [Pseudarthrobacter sp. W1I19]MDQ0923369.1 hypothetical protein [Pseudarthrobacter sp. W1I19]